MTLPQASGSCASGVALPPKQMHNARTPSRLKILELSAWTRGDETFRASKLRAGKVPKEQAPAPLAGESEELVEELSVLGDLNTHTHTLAGIDEALQCPTPVLLL